MKLIYILMVIALSSLASAVTISDRFIITKTGAEVNLDVSYTNLNETDTQFCLKPINFTAYTEELSKIGTTAKDIPISKLDSKASFDLYTTKINIAKDMISCFNIHYEKAKDVSIKIGYATIIIDGSIGSFDGTAKKICIDSLGNLNVAYVGGDSDLWYGKSTNNGTTWAISEIEAGTFEYAGIICYGDGENDVLVYASDSNNLLNQYYSTNGGSSFPTRINNTIANFTVPSCAIDTSNIIHCCGTNGATAGSASLVYANSTSSFNTGTILSSATSDSVDECSIEAGTNNCIYVAGVGTDHDQIDVWSNCISGWTTRQNVATLATHTTDNGLTITVYDHNGIDNIITAAKNNTFQVVGCNSTSDHLTVWSCQKISEYSIIRPTISADINNNVILTSTINSNQLEVNIINYTDMLSIWNVVTLPATQYIYNPSVAHQTYPIYARMNGILHIAGWRESTVDLNYYNYTYNISAYNYPYPYSLPIDFTSTSIANAIKVNQSFTNYINVSINKTSISGATIKWNGNYSTCYQETANVSTSCGGLATGIYTIDNSSTAYGFLYINYTIPSTSVPTSIWQVKHGSNGLGPGLLNGLTFNVSASNFLKCFSLGSPLQLRIFSDTGLISNYSSITECYNGFNWINLTSSYATGATGSWSGTNTYDIMYDGNWSSYRGYTGREWHTGNTNNSYSHIYEEAMWWNMTTNSTLVNTSSNIYYYYLNMTGLTPGNYSYSIIVYDKLGNSNTTSTRTWEYDAGQSNPGTDPCSPTLNADWQVTISTTCTNKNINIGTGLLNISSELILIDSNLTCARISNISRLQLNYSVKESFTRITG